MGIRAFYAADVGSRDWNAGERWFFAAIVSVLSLMALAAGFVEGAPFSDWSPVLGALAWGLLVCAAYLGITYAAFSRLSGTREAG